MTALQWTSIALLVIAVAISIRRHINLGTILFAGTLVLIVAGHVPSAVAYAAFPASLVVLIIGVTLLFAHAERSGAVTWLVDGCFRLVGGRTAFIPWIGFIVGAGLATMGAFPTAPISLLLPIMAALAARHRLSYPLLAVIVVLASNAAGLSPLSPAGATIQTICGKLHVSYSPWLLYAIVLGMHVILVAVLLLLHRLLRGNARWARFMQVDQLDTLAERVRSAQQPPLHVAPSQEPQHESTAYRNASLLSLVVFVAVVLIFGWDVGLVAISLSFLLQLIFRPVENELLRRVPWNVVLLLAGLVIYFGVLDKIGTLNAIESGLGSISNVTVLLILLVYVTGIVSNMESSTLATLGVMVPIGLGATNSSGIAPLAVLVAVVMSAAVVVMNPVHIAGALIVANTEEQRQDEMFRNLLAMSFAVTAVVPGLVVLIPILSRI